MPSDIVSSGELRNLNDPQSVSTDPNTVVSGRGPGEGISKFEVLTSPSANAMSPHVFMTNTDELQKGKTQITQTTNQSSKQQMQNQMMIQSPQERGENQKSE